MKYGSERTPSKRYRRTAPTASSFGSTTRPAKLRDKADEIKHKIGVVTGKDEIKLSEPNLIPRTRASLDPGTSSSTISPSITLVETDLKGGEGEIDDTLDGLIITQPRQGTTRQGAASHRPAS